MKTLGFIFGCWMMAFGIFVAMFGESSLGQISLAVFTVLIGAVITLASSADAFDV